MLSEYYIGPTVMVTLRSWHQNNCIFRAKEKLKNLDISDFLHQKPEIL